MFLVYINSCQASRPNEKKCRKIGKIHFHNKLKSVDFFLLRRSSGAHERIMCDRHGRKIFGYLNLLAFLFFRFAKMFSRTNEKKRKNKNLISAKFPSTAGQDWASQRRSHRQQLMLKIRFEWLESSRQKYPPKVCKYYFRRKQITNDFIHRFFCVENKRLLSQRVSNWIAHRAS